MSTKRCPSSTAQHRCLGGANCPASRCVGIPGEAERAQCWRCPIGSNIRHHRCFCFCRACCQICRYCWNSNASHLTGWHCWQHSG